MTEKISHRSDWTKWNFSDLSIWGEVVWEFECWCGAVLMGGEEAWTGAHWDWSTSHFLNLPKVEPSSPPNISHSPSDKFFLSILTASVWLFLISKYCNKFNHSINEPIHTSGAAKAGHLEWISRNRELPQICILHEIWLKKMYFTWDLIEDKYVFHMKFDGRKYLFYIRFDRRICILHEIW